MKISFIPITLILLSFLFANTTKANNAAAGELTYQWISDSTYQLNVALYRDCSGNTEPSTLQLCYADSCTGTIYSTTLNKATTSVPAFTPTCTNKTKCDDPLSTIPGFQVWTYTDTITLPSRCTNWRFYTYISNRNASNNLLAASKPLYLEATLNNTGMNYINSSPYFTNTATPYICNEPYSYATGVIDMDGDSLTTEVIDPLTDVYNCADTAKPIGYVTTSPPIVIPGNPFQTNETFYYAWTSSRLYFNSSPIGPNNIALRIREYRNGVLIGSVVREMQFQTMICAPQLTRHQQSCYVNCVYMASLNSIYACEGVPFSFCNDFVNADTDAIFLVSDNHLSKTPTATITYAGLGTDSVRAQTNFTATQAGFYDYTYTICDSSCKPPGIMRYYTTSIHITVLAIPSPLPDTTICLGDTAVIGIANTRQCTWAAIPPASLSSLSCTNCEYPFAFPTSTSSYIVTSRSLFCPIYTDTITVNVNTAFTYPTISISVAPDSNIAPGTITTFTANVSNCRMPAYQWVKNGGLVGSSGNIYTPLDLADNDYIYCILKCNDSCPSPRTSTSNTISIHISTNIKPVEENTGLQIWPNPNTGSFSLKGYRSHFATAHIEVLNLLGQVIYKNTHDIYTNEQTIDLGNIPHGNYVLRVDQHTYKFTVSK